MFHRFAITFGLIGLSINASVGLASVSNSLDILEKARKANLPLATSSWEATIEYTDVFDENEKLIVSEKVQRKTLDSKHVKVTQECTEKSRSNSGTAAETTHREFICGGEGHAIYVPEAGSASVWEAKDDVAWCDGILADAMLGGPLDGRVVINSHTGSNILDLAKTGTLSATPVTETLDGVDCYKISSRGPNWTIDCWIAPKMGYGIAKAHFTDASDPHAPNEVMIDNVEFKEVDGQTFPWKCRCVQKIAGAGSSTPEVVTASIERTSLQLQSTLKASDFSLTQIPDGTRVRVETGVNSGIQYYWSNGKAVPAHDASVVKAIAHDVAVHKSEDASGGSLGGGLWSLLGTSVRVLLFAGGVVLVRRRIAEKRSVHK